MNTVNETKYCIDCKQYLPLTHFSPQRRICIKCKNYRAAQSELKMKLGDKEYRKMRQQEFLAKWREIYA